jgi:hypothetical protein
MVDESTPPHWSAPSQRDRVRSTSCACPKSDNRPGPASRDRPARNSKRPMRTDCRPIHPAAPSPEISRASAHGHRARDKPKPATHIHPRESSGPHSTHLSPARSRRNELVIAGTSGPCACSLSADRNGARLYLLSARRSARVSGAIARGFLLGARHAAVSVRHGISGPGQRDRNHHGGCDGIAQSPSMSRWGSRTSTVSGRRSARACPQARRRC